jgi:hypothetical protein
VNLPPLPKPYPGTLVLLDVHLLFAGDVPHRRDDGRSSSDGNPSPSALAVDFTPPFGDWP